MDARDVLAHAAPESLVETVSLLPQGKHHASCALACLVDRRIGNRKRSENVVEAAVG